MKKTMILVFAVSCLFFLSGTKVFAEKKQGVYLNYTGEIRGGVESCTPDAFISGALVHIPGLSIMAKTDINGAFRLLNVPKGTHKVIIEVSGVQPAVLSNIEVFPRTITDIDFIRVCDECFKNSDCPSDSYCLKNEGECGAMGICMKNPAPFPCPIPPYEPVCGCDGKTYDNTCFAAAAGVSIDHQGRCGPLPPCVNNDDCDSRSLYCLKTLGECGVTGTCTVKPFTCFVNGYEPVCGCDGITYDNACTAAMHGGVSIAWEGPCEPLSPCTDNVNCESISSFLYCAKGIGDCSGEGICEEMPLFCAVNPNVYEPVCGCDGKAYDNTCLASTAGASVAYDGECQ
jgi:hypothetical protein